jgi:hypothetical protein
VYTVQKHGTQKRAGVLQRTQVDGVIIQSVPKLRGRC